MKQSLFAKERLFELCFLYPFSFDAMTIAGIAIFHSDWGAAGICGVALFLNGVIGARLYKNRRKSMAQLAAGSAGEPYASNEWDPADDQKIGRSLSGFFLLVAATAGALALHHGKPWWFIVGTIIGSWVFFLLSAGLLGFLLLRRSK
ncbi:MAG: hypothetical protein WA733_08010 [Methylocystis sp.]